MNKQVEKNMSYSYELKCELCSHKKNICCKKSLIYGFLLLANTFRQDKIKIHTHHKEILDYLISLISKICSVDASKLKICESSGRNKAYICVIEEPDIIKSIIGSVDVYKRQVKMLFGQLAACLTDEPAQQEKDIK